VLPAKEVSPATGVSVTGFAAVAFAYRLSLFLLPHIFIGKAKTGTATANVSVGSFIGISSVSVGTTLCAIQLKLDGSQNVPDGAAPGSTRG
jgi:hypothetical protein